MESEEQFSITRISKLILAVRLIDVEQFIFCYFPESDQCNWEVDQGPEQQQYVFPRGLGLFGSYPCLTHLEKQPTHCFKLFVCFMLKHVLIGESNWVLSIINNKGLSAMVTDSKI